MLRYPADSSPHEASPDDESPDETTPGTNRPLDATSPGRLVPLDEPSPRLNVPCTKHPQDEASPWGRTIRPRFFSQNGQNVPVFWGDISSIFILYCQHYDTQVYQSAPCLILTLIVNIFDVTPPAWSRRGLSGPDRSGPALGRLGRTARPGAGFARPGAARGAYLQSRSRTKIRIKVLVGWQIFVEFTNLAWLTEAATASGGCFITDSFFVYHQCKWWRRRRVKWLCKPTNFAS
jgi:hypothetical protein